MLWNLSVDGTATMDRYQNEIAPETVCLFLEGALEDISLLTLKGAEGAAFPEAWVEFLFRKRRTNASCTLCEELLIFRRPSCIPSSRVAVNAVEKRVCHLVCNAPPGCCFLNFVGRPREQEQEQG